MGARFGAYENIILNIGRGGLDGLLREFKTLRDDGLRDVQLPSREFLHDYHATGDRLL